MVLFNIYEPKINKQQVKLISFYFVFSFGSLKEIVTFPDYHAKVVESLASLILSELCTRQAVSISRYKTIENISEDHSPLRMNSFLVLIILPVFIQSCFLWLMWLYHV